MQEKSFKNDRNLRLLRKDQSEDDVVCQSRYCPYFAISPFLTMTNPTEQTLDCAKFAVSKSMATKLSIDLFTPVVCRLS
jgi:hypothetical protein